MREELRLAIALVLAGIIIFIFGRYQARQAPHAARPALPQTVSSAKETPEEKPIAFSHASRTIRGKEEIYEDSRFIIKLDTAGGIIRDIGLKEYTRKDEASIPIFEDSDLLLNHAADDTENVPASYAFSKTGSVISFQDYSGNMLTEKTINIPADSYTFSSALLISNRGKDSISLKNYMVSAGRIDIANMRSRIAKERQFTPPEIIISTGGKMVKTSITRIRASSTFENTDWIALKQRYGLLLIRSERSTKSFVTLEDSCIRIGFLYEKMDIKPGDSEKLGFSFYAGPSDYFIAGKEIAEKQIFGTGFFASMGRFLFTALSYIHTAVPNWGWSIILLTLIVKIVFFPLTRKSLRSMKEMQKLRPYLQDVQKKYKNNPQQMQKELMNLYREYKINPFGGCLPMLIQFPIFIGFFIALRSSVILRGAPFMLWIKDLSLPDTIMKIGGFNLNLLPVIMSVTSFWQQKLTPQEPSQKALTFMMPVMFLFLFYNFSSGLLLYWTTMNAAGLVEQYFVHKK